MGESAAVYCAIPSLPTTHSHRDCRTGTWTGTHETLALGISDSLVMSFVLMTMVNTEVSA